MRRKSWRSDCRAISASAPASSTPVGPAPTMTNVSRRRCASRVRFTLGRFERQQHPPPHLERIVQRLQPGRARRPFGMAEVRVRRAGRQHEIVVRDRLGAVDHHAAPGGIDLAHVRQQHLDVLLVAQDPANRRRDVARRQRRRRHLIQQRLEEMVVVAIEQRDADVRARERARRVEPAESAADDHDEGGSLVLTVLPRCYRIRYGVTAQT